MVCARTKTGATPRVEFIPFKAVIQRRLAIHNATARCLEHFLR
jgi:hypothetical protein